MDSGPKPPARSTTGSTTRRAPARRCRSKSPTSRRPSGRPTCWTAGDRTKPPLVALHGLSINSTMWLPLLQALTDTHHVRMLDRVGDLNKSRATAVVPNPSRVVDWLDQTLDALEIRRAALVGLSIGSWMSAHYAMARPNRVERVALLAPVGIVSLQHPKWLAAHDLQPPHPADCREGRTLLRHVRHDRIASALE